MLRPVLLLLYLSTVSYVSYAQSATLNDRLTAARESKDYVGLTTLLDSVERSGQLSAELYLAQGNARYESGDYGLAILAFERGLRLRPGHRALGNNLRYVREESGLTAPTLPDFFLRRWWQQIGAVLGTTTAYVIALVLWWVAVAGVLYWLLQRKKMREKRRFALLPLAATAAVLSVVCYFLGAKRTEELRRTDAAVLIANDAPLRVSPSLESSVEATLIEGQKLSITDRVNRFVKVRLDDGRQGYLLLQELAVI